MINFQRQIDEYKDSKRNLLKRSDGFAELKKEIVCEIKLHNSRVTAGEKGLRMGYVNVGNYLNLFSWSRSMFQSYISQALGMLTFDMENDLGEAIISLRKAKEKVANAKILFFQGNLPKAFHELSLAERYFREFEEKEFEEILLFTLKKHVSKIKIE